MSTMVNPDASTGERDDLLAESSQLPTTTQSSPEVSTGQRHMALPPAGAGTPTDRAAAITFACYFVALASLTVSLNTSWRFFAEVLHIPTDNGERLIMFTVAEMALIVSGAGMAVNVRRTGQPGPFRVVVWGMCAVSGYMAWQMSDVGEGLARVILGPILGAIMLHLALGLELRTRHHRTGTLARIGRELRERMLSRLGLADDERDALQRTRDRAAHRAAQLSLPRRWRWSRQARLQKALIAANIADDQVMRDKMLARLSVLRHAHELANYDQSSPWLHLDDEETPAAPGDGEGPWGATRAHRNATMNVAPAESHAPILDTPSDISTETAEIDPAPTSALALAATERVPSTTAEPEETWAGELRHAEHIVNEGITGIGRTKVAQVLHAHRQGTPPATIARKLHVGYRTVVRILDHHSTQPAPATV